jgi:hypothetical protein
MRRQADLFLKEPQQRLPNRAALEELAEHEKHRFLNSLVGILLQALVLGSEEPNRRGHNQLAASGLGQSRIPRMLTKQIQFVLVKRPLQTQQEPVIAQPRRVDRVLIEQQGIDHPAHLDQLLPLTTVAGKPRHFTSGDDTDVTEAHLGHHPLEYGFSVFDRAAGRTTRF